MWLEPYATLSLQGGMLVPTARYDAIAAWYDTTVRSGLLFGDVVLVSLFDLIGDVAGCSLCDLACGQGRIARELARRGARVVGVDLSSELIAIAQRDERTEGLGITYLVDDAEHLVQLGEAQFDGIVCNLALMDIPDLAAAARAISRILHPGGWLVFSITHPCFEAPHAQWLHDADGTLSRAISQYFQEGEWFSTNKEGVRGQVGAQHRMVSTYLNTFVAAGFNLEHIAEPHVTGELAVRMPAYCTVPPFMLMCWIKPST